MTTVFIVRPFGEKSILSQDEKGDCKSVLVDFDAIDSDIIQQALKENGLKGTTTGAIAKAGNIRLDMFQMLISADLVIADISIDNANVFYELGIRHGLRPNGTILIRSSLSTGSDVPFDLKTDRYIRYDQDDTQSAVTSLATTIRETLQAIRALEAKPDSPVFLLLPDLSAPDPSALYVVPREFQEAVERAAKGTAYPASMLALLGEEAKQNAWGREGVRLVGRAQRGLCSFKAARDSWESIRKELPNDIEANLQLATVYQRLGDLISSSQACWKVLEHGPAGRQARADARSQLARNQKTQWVGAFRAGISESARRQLAIRDNRLIDAYQGYLSGFAEDLNDYYSGINALGLLTTIVELATAEPVTWAGCFDTERRAGTVLSDYQDELDRIRGAVRMSLDAARRRNDQAGEVDEFLRPSEAQFLLLTSKNHVYVQNAYQSAKNAGGDNFSVHSEAAQVAIYSSLGLYPDNCRAAFTGLGVAPEKLADVTPAIPAMRGRIVVITGHRADSRDRPPPARFPNTPEAIAAAKAWLRQAVDTERAECKGSLVGVGGAASGADLLFHEVCAEAGVPSQIVLPIPKLAYSIKSVADGGADWVEKFNRVTERNPPLELSDHEELPIWAETISNYSVFQRGNVWLIKHALLQSNVDVTLLALWNGEAGDGPGGTQDMIALAQSHGAKVRIMSSDKLFGLKP
jgi:tetratricopeptide repeat protein